MLIEEPILLYGGVHCVVVQIDTVQTKKSTLLHRCPKD